MTKQPRQFAFLSVLLIAILCTAAQAAPPDSTPMLRNGDLSQVDPAGIPVGWTAGSPGCKVDATVDGSRALLLESDGSIPPGPWTSDAAPIAVEKDGVRVTFRYRLETKDPGFQASVIWLDDPGAARPLAESLAFLVGGEGTDFTGYTFVAPKPAKARWFKIALGTKRNDPRKGKLWVRGIAVSADLSAEEIADLGVTMAQQVEMNSYEPVKNTLNPLPQVIGIKKVLTLADFGAVGDGKTVDTKALQAGIDAVNAQGGGTLNIPAGTYLSSTIFLKSNVTMQFDHGATLLLIADCAAVPLVPSPLFKDGMHSLIRADNQENIALVGDGVIDGQGASDTWKDWGKYGAAEFANPTNITFISCKNVLVRGLTIRNSPNWNQHYLNCDTVRIEDITVRNLGAGNNNDGIDLNGCQNVTMTGCDLISGDDAICLKASLRDCREVVIGNCKVSSHCNALKFGTASVGGYKNIAISNCILYDTRLAGLAIESVDGGVIENVAVSNIVMNNVSCPIYIRLGARLGTSATKIREPKDAPGAIRRILISDVIAVTNREHTPGAGGKPGPTCSSISGIPGTLIEDITLRNIRITGMEEVSAAAANIPLDSIPQAERSYPESDIFGPLPAYGIFIRNARNIALDGVQFDWQSAEDNRSALVCDNVSDLRVTGFRAKSIAAANPTIRLRDVEHADLRACRALENTPVFLSLEGTTSDVSLTDSDLREAKTGVGFASHENKKGLYQAGNR